MQALLPAPPAACRGNCLPPQVACVGCPGGAALSNDNLISIFQACYRIGHFQTEKGRDTSGGCLRRAAGGAGGLAGRWAARTCGR